MLKLVELDKHVPITAQIQQDVGPVTLINTFTVDAADVDPFLKTWANDAEVMKRQPGFVSAQLHRGIAGSCVFVNYAVWESVAAFRTAFSQPDFQASVKNYPASTVASPHLFQKVAVPGICPG